MDWWGNLEIFQLSRQWHRHSKQSENGTCTSKPILYYLPHHLFIRSLYHIRNSNRSRPLLFSDGWTWGLAAELADYYQSSAILMPYILYDHRLWIYNASMENLWPEVGPAGEHSYGSHDHGGRDGDSWEIYKDLYSLYLYICRELNILLKRM